MRLHAKQEELIELQLESLRREANAARRTLPPPPVADVRIDLIRDGSQHRFVITNWGQGPARNVTFDIALRPNQSSPFVHGNYDENIPIAALAPGSRCSILAALTFGTGTAFDATWTWINPDGSPSRRTSLLTT